jgi:hypothetical protein
MDGVNIGQLFLLAGVAIVTALWLLAKRTPSSVPRLQSEAVIQGEHLAVEGSPPDKAQVGELGKLNK